MKNRRKSPPKTEPNTQRTPPDAGSGEPTAGSPGPDTWPFAIPTAQRERVAPEPVPDEGDREGGRGDRTDGRPL